MTPSVEALLAIAQRYWDSSSEYRLRQEVSPERKRLQRLWDAQRKDMARWWTFLEELKSSLPGSTLGHIVTTADAALRCIVYPPELNPPPSHAWAVVGCVSILAPVYTVYGVEYEHIHGKRSDFKAHFEPDSPEMEPSVRSIARQIETSFGFSAVSHEVARTPVPLFVEFKEPPLTTLFHALFTSEPESIL